MKRNSNQRITKIKKDFLDDLLKKAEAMDVADAASIQPIGSDLTPYPNMNNLRLWTRDYLLKGLNKIYPVDITEDGQTYLTTIVDGLPLFTKLTKTVGTTASNYETSKPGLWLSNLCQPVSGSYAGAWLRQNLINSNSSSYNQVNADVIGNYTYSFYQRGIIKRTAGSYHDNEDSYCQHWSPSALSCISHDGMIIPTNNLRSDYTSYQTLVVPSDADMQQYEETRSKNVTYNFADNDNSPNVNVTNFNGRVVGDGWSYEFVFTPNGQGSGNAYGSGSGTCDRMEDENCSNGGCVTGSITYETGGGTECSQVVDECFGTIQALSNPNVPERPGANNTNTLPNNDVYTFKKHISCTCDYTSSPALCITAPKILSLKVVNSNAMTGGGFYGRCYSSSSSSIRNISIDGGCYGSACNVGDSDIGAVSWTYSGGTQEHPEATQIFSFPANTKIIHLNYNHTGTQHCNDRGIDATLTASYDASFNPTPSNINLYFNVIDQKREYEAMGIPWEYGCDIPRFSFEFSTEECNREYCTSFLLASNVSINNLGDINHLQVKSFSNIIQT